MKLRLVKRYKAKHIYCSNGTTIDATKDDVIRLLTDFKKPNSFKGADGFWLNNIADMEDAPGETIAYVDDTNKLIILDKSVFDGIIKPEVQYISASEYADLKGKSRPSIKNMCAAGRIAGAYKTSSGWLIPADAPYPERKKREVKKK